MSRPISVFVVSCLMLIQLACGDISKESRKWRDELHETAGVLAKSADGLAKAVPGERLLRLIEDAHNKNDPQAAERAKTIAKEWFQLDVDRNFDVSVAFGFDEASAFRADIFRGAAPIAALVQNRCNIDKAMNAAPVMNSLAPPPTRDEIKGQIKSRILDALNILATPTSDRYDLQTYDTAGEGAGPRPFLCLSGIMGCVFSRDWPRLHAQIAKAKDAAANKLAEAVFSAYSSRDLPLSAAMLTKSWNVLDSNQLLFIVIRDEDWQLHRADPEMQIRAIVHERGKPGVPFNNLRAYSFEREEFDANPIVDCHGPDYKVRWAAHNMTDASLLSPEFIENLQRVRELLGKFEAEQRY